MKSGEYTHVTMLGSTSVEETGDFDVAEFRAAIARTNKDVTQMDEVDLDRYLADQAFGDDS